MMSPAKLLASSPAANAPGVKEGAPDGAVPATADEGFDTILMLESLAASAAFDTAELGATGLEDDAGDADDASTEDLDDPLAFLAGLLAMQTPPAAPRDAAANAGDDAQDGGTAPLPTGVPQDSTLSALPMAADTDASNSADAARLLAAQAAVLAAGTDAQGADPASGASRVADLFAQALRNPTTAAVEHSTIATHVRDPRWAEELGSRVTLMLNNRESIAALQLTPADLGPVDVSITVRDSQTTILFGAAQADTRALLEASLPRLREMLAAQGFNLLDASVSQGFTRRPNAETSTAPRSDGDAEIVGPAARSVQLSGLLDVYA
jgi:flagellar hook-length control protein FliK